MVKDSTPDEYILSGYVPPLLSINFYLARLIIKTRNVKARWITVY